VTAVDGRAGTRGLRAVLLVDHGSRRPEANEALASAAEALRRRLPDRVVQCAHLEVAQPDVARGIDACVESGATDIAVLPWFLAPGRHTSEDLPRLVAASAARHPGLRVAIAPPLGSHPALLEAALDCVAELERGG